MEQGHLDWLNKGQGSFEAWRRQNRQTRPDLSGADLRNMNLSGFDLRDANLRNAQLDGTQLKRTNFSGADLTKATLVKANASEAIFDKADLTEANATECNFDAVQFIEATLVSCVFRTAKMVSANFDKAKARAADFEAAEMPNARFRSADFHAASFRRANLSGVHAEGSFESVDFVEANLTSATFSNASLKMSDFTRAKCGGMNVVSCNATEARFVDANLENSKCQRTFFTNAILDGARLDGASMHDANLCGASLQKVSVNAKTDFALAEVKGCSIQRFTLECLKDYGGLTPGDRMQMRISDAVAELRSSYSGFYQWVHLVALFIFLAPYIWFLTQQWAEIRFNPLPGTGITLLEALARFITSGGESWRNGWSFNPWAFLPFCYALSYNALRFVLLWKTKSLELQQESTGLPVEFSLAGTAWGKMYATAKVLFWGNILAVTIHTVAFLMTRLPASVL